MTRADTVLAGDPQRGSFEDDGTYARAMAVNRSRKSRVARRRKRRMDSVEHDLSDEQWIALKAAWSGCAYCGATPSPCSVTACCPPLTRRAFHARQHRPGLRSCNASKCNDEVTGWLRRKRFDERAFLMRQHEIKETLALRFAAAGNDAGIEAPEAAVIHRA